MRRQLHLHPHFECDAVERIEVEVARAPHGLLTLRYLVVGSTGDVRFPPLTVPARTSELWEHTCCEAFLRRPGHDGYYEFNFAPSTRWAAYWFPDYRQGMSLADVLPQIEIVRADSGFELRASITLNALTGPWQLGVSAVIEEKNGRKSYWALAHPPGKADFHHPDSFILSLPADP